MYSKTFAGSRSPNLHKVIQCSDCSLARQRAQTAYIQGIIRFHTNSKPLATENISRVTSKDETQTVNDFMTLQAYICNQSCITLRFAELFNLSGIALGSSEKQTIVGLY